MAELAEPPEDLRGFPTRRLEPIEDLYRIHHAENEAWWFSSDLSGRFDLPVPNGTCYLALAPRGAFIEVFTNIRMIAQSDVDTRRLATLNAPQACRMADCTSPRAAGFGATGAIHTTTDYALTQRWAAQFLEKNFEGVFYFCGHDPAVSEVAVAIFGRQGLSSWPTGSSRRITADLLADVETHFGITVRPTP